MPEGDSLVRAAYRLRPVLQGRVLRHADLRVPRHATARLEGWRVAEVRPLAKYLLMRLTPPADLDGAVPLTLVSHLKMEGRWLTTVLDAPWSAPGWQVRCVLETDEHRVLGAQLGLLELVRTDREHTVVGHLGPDLLDPGWDESPERAATLLAEGVRRLVERPERPVGLALLDQRLVSGIGNVYRCEILLLAGIDPHRPIGDVEDVPGLVTIARDLLRANVPPAAPALGAERRTTGVHRDEARPYGIGVEVPDGGHGELTAAQVVSPAGAVSSSGAGLRHAPQRTARNGLPSYWVYGHATTPCLRCGGRVRKEDYGSPEDAERQLWWCPNCQW